MSYMSLLSLPGREALSGRISVSLEMIRRVYADFFLCIGHVDILCLMYCILLWLMVMTQFSSGNSTVWNDAYN